MTKNYDEPKYIEVKREDAINNKQKKKSIETIKDLCNNQAFAVLATQGDKECYNSLISFVSSEDYSYMVFASPVNTRKTDSIKQNGAVSILIDNRNDNPKNINDIVAITATGKARILEKEKIWSSLLINKHNYLKGFIEAPSTALVLIEISQYSYVSSFQEVFEWSPISNK